MSTVLCSDQCRQLYAVTNDDSCLIYTSLCTYEVRVKYQSRRRKPLNTTDLYFVMYGEIRSVVTDDVPNQYMFAYLFSYVS